MELSTPVIDIALFIYKIEKNIIIIIQFIY